MVGKAMLSTGVLSSRRGRHTAEIFQYMNKSVAVEPSKHKEQLLG